MKADNYHENETNSDDRANQHGSQTWNKSGLIKGKKINVKAIHLRDSTAYLLVRIGADRSERIISMAVETVE
jgi:hypothetical protein